MLSPCRFQKHVHTYRILPDEEDFLAVQVGAAGTDGDTPRPSVQGGLGSVVTPSPPGDRWGHPMATPPQGSGHHGHPISTLGTDGDTPRPSLHGGLGSVVTPSPS